MLKVDECNHDNHATFVSAVGSSASTKLKGTELDSKEELCWLEVKVLGK